MGKTSLGLEENIEGALAYLLGVITGILFYLLEKENKFVRFHALQSILLFGGLWVINLVLAATIIGVLLVPLVNLAGIILWLFSMYKAYKGEMYKYPIIGEIAEKHA